MELVIGKKVTGKKSQKKSHRKKVTTKNYRNILLCSVIYVALDKRVATFNFSYFSSKVHVVGSH